MNKILQKLAFGNSLSEEEMERAVELLVSDENLPEAVIGAFLYATATRPPTAAELVGAAKVLRRHCELPIVKQEFGGVDLLDTCGTGGSTRSKFNISTAAAFVAAACGQPVAKHGNRAVTGSCGSADLLEAAGAKIELSAEQVVKCIKKTGFGFLFAPHHHKATSRVGPIRKALGLRTLFNHLGPLVNPFQVSLQLLGTSDVRAIGTVAETLLRLGIKRAMVISSPSGLDEVSLIGETKVAEVKEGFLSFYSLTPEDLGLAAQESVPEAPKTPAERAELLQSMLAGEDLPHRDWVIAASGAALYVSGKAASVKEGCAASSEAIRSGAAKRVLEQFVAFTNQGPV